MGRERQGVMKKKTLDLRGSKVVTKLMMLKNFCDDICLKADDVKEVRIAGELSSSVGYMIDNIISGSLS
jgi:hypothetical protein